MTSKENRRSPRYTPASQVSVMLYRDNARPRGCYVGNYSKHGVILKCSALETDVGKALQVGDEVSLHFWDRGEPGHSIKVSGHIVRFGENQVAIEYASPSSASLERLLTLLDQRVEQSSTEEDTMKDLPKLRLPDKPRPKRADDTEILGRRPVEPTIHESHENTLSPGLILGLLIAAIVGIVGLGLYSFRLSDQLYELNETVISIATQPTTAEDSPVTELSQRVGAIEDLTQRIAIEDLMQRITAIEDKQQDLGASLDQVVKQEDLQAAVDKLNVRLQESQQKATPAAPTTTRKTKPEAAAPPVSTGQWTIHLAALSDEKAVDKFINKAKSLGIDVQKEQITVNEKQMYRLSIPGLASYDEAEKLADEVQKKMALRQKPWIAKR
ncbi:MAG: SPOR domain-containing protein [Arenicellales bacterium]|nr:SPOR domain-containing protein [Arenicellales bacterium]